MNPLMRLAPALLLLLPAFASADLYTVEKNGQIIITSKKVRGARVLHHVKDGKSAAPQRRAARRARKAAGPFTGDRAARARRFAGTVRAAAVHYALPEPLIWAVMKTESDFHPHVVSHKGAQGLLQLMPGTADDMGVTDPFDPDQNIYGGARFLRLLANKFDGDLVLTLSAYHAGGARVRSVGGIPHSQTAEYVRRVLNAYYAYQKKLPI